MIQLPIRRSRSFRAFLYSQIRPCPTALSMTSRLSSGASRGCRKTPTSAPTINEPAQVVQRGRQQAALLFGKPVIHGGVVLGDKLLDDASILRRPADERPQRPGRCPASPRRRSQFSGGAQMIQLPIRPLGHFGQVSACPVAQLRTNKRKTNPSCRCPAGFRAHAAGLRACRLCFRPGRLCFFPGRLCLFPGRLCLFPGRLCFFPGRRVPRL